MWWAYLLSAFVGGVVAIAALIGRRGDTPPWRTATSVHLLLLGESPTVPGLRGFEVRWSWSGSCLSKRARSARYGPIAELYCAAVRTRSPLQVDGT